MRKQIKRQSNQRLRYSTTFHHLKPHENHWLWEHFRKKSQKSEVPSNVEGLTKQKRKAIKMFQPFEWKNRIVPTLKREKN